MSNSVSEEIATLREQGLWRELRTLESPQGCEIDQDGRRFINFSSNDYLGLANAPEVTAALHEGIDLYGAGAGASRLVCGTLRPHVELEQAVAAFKGADAALCFASGYAAALGVIPALAGAGDTVILDKLCHASLVDAARLSGATLRVFPHNQLGKLERLLSGRGAGDGGRTLIVTESIFSMDGDSCPLREIVDLKDRHGAWLMLDEAHAVGVLGPQGRGLAAQHGLETRVDLQMGTFSKALGLSGGYLAASRQIIDLLINRARSFIYSTAPPPAIAHAARAALQLAAGSEGDRRRDCLWQNIRALQSRLPTAGDTAAAILPLMVGDEAAAMALSARLRESGFLIPAIRYPTVARGKARLRLTLSAGHTEAQIEALAENLARFLPVTVT